MTSSDDSLDDAESITRTHELLTHAARSGPAGLRHLVKMALFERERFTDSAGRKLNSPSVGAGGSIKSPAIPAIEPPVVHVPI